MKKFSFLVIFLILLLPTKIFAATPDISADKKYFNLLKGHCVLKGNVCVVLDNRGLKAKVVADEARVNILSQKCWATGNVKFIHENFIFSCEKTFLQWQTKTADVSGSVKFERKNFIFITSDSATFNWIEKIADFYGNVKITPKDNFQVDENLNLEEKIYAHVKFDVRENKILQLEEDFDKKIIIPESDVEVDE